jgi:hypothetical protein
MGFVGKSKGIDDGADGARLSDALRLSDLRVVIALYFGTK